MPCHRRQSACAVPSACGVSNYSPRDTGCHPATCHHATRPSAPRYSAPRYSAPCQSATCQNHCLQDNSSENAFYGDTSSLIGTSCERRRRQNTRFIDSSGHDTSCDDTSCQDSDGTGSTNDGSGSYILHHSNRRYGNSSHDTHSHHRNNHKTQFGYTRDVNAPINPSCVQNPRYDPNPSSEYDSSSSRPPSSLLAYFLSSPPPHLCEDPAEDEDRFSQAPMSSNSCDSSQKSLCRSHSLVSRDSYNGGTMFDNRRSSKHATVSGNKDCGGFMEELPQSRKKCSRQVSHPTSVGNFHRHSTDCSNLMPSVRDYNQTPSLSGLSQQKRKSDHISALPTSNQGFSFQQTVKTSPGGNIFVTNTASGGGTVRVRKSSTESTNSVINVNILSNTVFSNHNLDFMKSLNTGTAKNDLKTNDYKSPLATNGGSLMFDYKESFANPAHKSKVFLPDSDAEARIFSLRTPVDSDEDSDGCGKHGNFKTEQNTLTTKENLKNTSTSPASKENKSKNVNDWSPWINDGASRKDSTKGGEIISEKAVSLVTPHQIDQSLLMDILEKHNVNQEINVKTSFQTVPDGFATTASVGGHGYLGSRSHLPTLTINQENIFQNSDSVPTVTSSVTTEVRMASPVSAASNTTRLSRDQNRFSFKKDTNGSSLQIDINLRSTITANLPLDLSKPRLVDHVATKKLAREEVEYCGWYYPSMNETEAANRLQKCDEGTFLLRDSSQPNVDYCLSVQTCIRPFSIRIYYDKETATFGPESSGDSKQQGRSSVLSLVEGYVKQGDLLVCCESSEYRIKISGPLRNNVPSLSHSVRLSYNKNRIRGLESIPHGLRTYLDSYSHAI